ncbi:hypothetical protein HMI56_001035 [Coelomomyces lativittatus]|nr:hypothetical protein HMI56_001035 [Coelomomyces lativittatus]
MREKLLRCLQYCCYKPGCIIIKQGHEPKSFYFILSGTAQVYRTENNVQLTLSELQPGDSFGEVALLKNTRRSASVICKTMVEAFSVDKEDFHEVLKKTAEEDQSLKMEFLKSIPLFHDQPNPVLLRLAEVCVKQERGTNVVLVKEKEVLSDLFILRKGSVRLVKILPFWKVHFSGGGKKQFTLVPAIPSTSSVSGFLPPRFIHHQQPQPYLHLTQPKHHLKTQSAKKASTENPWLVFPRTLPKTPKEIKKKTPPVATTTLQEVGTRRDSSFPMSEHDLSKAVDPSCLERMSPSSLGSSSSSSPSSSSSSGVTTSIHGHEEPSKRSLQKKGKTKETPFSSSSSSSSSSTSTSTSSDDEDTPTNEHDPDLNSDLPHESASEQEEKEETKKPKKKEKAFLHLHPQETEPNLTTTTTTTSTHPSSIPPLHRPFPKNRGSGSPLPPSPTTPAPQLVYKLVCVGALGPGQFFGEECLQEETKGGEGGGPSGSTLSNPPSLTLPPHPLLPPPPPPPNSSSPASSLPPSSQSSSSTPNHYANTLYSSPSHLLDSFNAPSPTPPTSTSTSTSFPSSSSSSSPPPHVTSSSSSSLLTSSMTHGTGTGSTRPGSVYSVITCEPTEIFKISKVDFVKLVPMYLPPPPIWTRPKVEEENKQETEKNPWMEEGVSKMPRSLSMSSSMSMSMSMSMSFTGWMLRPFQDRYLATLRWLHWKAHVLRHLHEEVQHSKHRFHTTPMFRNEDMLKSMKAGVKRSMSKKSILHQTQPQVQTEKPPPPSSTMLSKKKKRGEKHPGNEKKKEKEKEKEKFHRPMNSKRQERKDSKETDEEEDVDEEGREKRTPTPPRSLSMSLTSSSFKMNRPSLPRKK